MELIKEKIRIDKYPGIKTERAMTEGDIIISDVKPDIGEIIKYNVRGFITEGDYNGSKLNFKGKLKVSVIYRPRGENGSPQCIRAELALNDFVPIDDSGGGEIIIRGLDIKNSAVSIINDRKLKYRIDMDICCIHKEGTELEVVTDVKGLPEEQIKKRELIMSQTSALGSETFTISEELKLSGEKGEIVEIYDCELMARPSETKLSGDRMTVGGELVLHILYKPTEGEEVDILEYELPINGSIDMKNAVKGENFCDLKLNVLDDRLRVKEDENGENRIIDFEADIQAVYRVIENINRVLPEDIYVLDKQTKTDRAETEYPLIICKNKNQFSVKGTAELEEGMPQILKICSIYYNVICDNVEIYEDKAVLEGIVEAKILYIAKDDTEPVCCLETMLPYRQTVELKGLKPNSEQKTDIEVLPEHISWSTLDSSEVEIKPVLCVSAVVYENKKAELITNAELCDLNPDFLDSLASMTLYVVKKGDTLWNIAKKYNTTIGEIAEINSIENPDLIYPGDKLLIVKRIGEG